VIANTPLGTIGAVAVFAAVVTRTTVGTIGTKATEPALNAGTTVGAVGTTAIPTASKPIAAGGAAGPGTHVSALASCAICAAPDSRALVRASIPRTTRGGLAAHTKTDKDCGEQADTK